MVSEIELRLDRLRALYEQYFMGYEKLEPQVQRKDLERRFQILRKENFRNTALRFRLNVAIQKYSTYQSYWQRICRQIEEGTYKRHVQRAKARFAEREAKAGRRADGDLDLDIDVELEDDEAFLASLHEDEPDVTFEEDEAFDTVRPNPQTFSEAPPTAHDPASFRSYSPGTLRGPPPPAALSALPHDTLPPPDTQRQGVPSPLSSRPLLRPSLRPIAPAQASPGQANQANQSSQAHQAHQAHQKAGPPGPAERGIPDAAPRGLPLPPRPGAPAAPATPFTPRAAPSAPAIARPAPPSAPRPGPQSVTQTSRAPQPASGGNLSEDRIRQIYSQYVREKRSRGESTATTTFESVARSLRSSSEKLRGQHGGRDVDFEVAEKDGRTILKPVVK